MKKFTILIPLAVFVVLLVLILPADQKLFSYGWWRGVLLHVGLVDGIVLVLVVIGFFVGSAMAIMIWSAKTKGKDG